jgi:hypothetical protein
MRQHHWGLLHLLVMLFLVKETMGCGFNDGLIYIGQAKTVPAIKVNSTGDTYVDIVTGANYILASCAGLYDPTSFKVVWESDKTEITPNFIRVESITHNV